MGLSVVVPAYNEEDSIADTVVKLKKIRCIDEIIVVNDGSTDGTKRILISLRDIKVLNHGNNLGYGAALKTGFSHASNEHIGFIDADLTYPSEMIPVLLYCLKEANLDCVWGNRFGKEGNRVNFVRRVGNFIISILATLILLKRIEDVTCGERVFRRDVLDKIDYKSLPDDLHFIVAFTKRIVQRGNKFKEIPISYYNRRGKSKLRIFKHGFLMIFALFFS